MGLISFLYGFLLLCFTFTAASIAYSPAEIIRLDCGATSNSTVPEENRTWNPDSGSEYMPAHDSSSVISEAAQLSSVEQIPYLTARIFPSQFTYTFPVASGPKFLRLYFYSAAYSGRDITKSFFNVSAAGHTLLANFSVYLSANTPSFFKEFIVFVGGDSQSLLQLTFTPTSSVDSYAFINGIEIVSMPDNLYITGANSPAAIVGQNSTFVIDTNTALETLYRLNVGGGAINVKSDTGMFRSWENDKGFLIGGGLVGKEPHVGFNVLYNNKTPDYTAPEDVYRSQRSMGPDQNNLMFNLSWIFNVDSGFSYLVRLHFCEFIVDVTGTNQLVFTVFLGDQIADKSVDVFRRAGGTRIPIFSDYVVSVPAAGNDDIIRKKQDLTLSLTPYVGPVPKWYDAILNGVEIMKLNLSDGSLAGPNPPRPLRLPTIPGSNPHVFIGDGKRKECLVGAVIAIAIAGGGTVVIIFILIIFKRRIRKVKHNHTLISSSHLPSELCRHFLIAEMKIATRNFDQNLLIGAGGFGNVYKGYIDNGATAVAIKRLNPESKQGAREFLTEIQMLSKLRHLHLVSLIGYCDDDGEMLLVYEYMSHGTLREHLYNTENAPLSWNQRLQICIGSARGLHYLHTGGKQAIIHRDVKSTNILLDEKWVAKVSDFGLSKLGPTDLSQTGVTTAVKGSVGYIDPEYYRRKLLTEKSDVYSFGVVLLEVACGRAAVVAKGSPIEQVSLAEWARQCSKKGSVDTMVDPVLEGQVAPKCMNKFFEVALNCIRENGTERPAMEDVLWSLEFAMQLQESAEKDLNKEGEGSSTPGGSVSTTKLLDGGPTTSDHSEGSSMGESGGSFTTVDQCFKLT